MNSKKIKVLKYHATCNHTSTDTKQAQFMTGCMYVQVNLILSKGSIDEI